MSIEKRMIVAVVLSAGVIILWNILFMEIPEVPAAKDTTETTSAEEAEKTAGEEAQDRETEGETPLEESELFERPTEPVAVEEERTIEIETDLYKVVLTNRNGGSVSNWILKNFESSYSDAKLDLVPAQDYSLAQYPPLATLLVRPGKEKPIYTNLEKYPQVKTPESGSPAFDESGQAVVEFEYFEPEVGWIVKRLTFRRESYIVNVDLMADLEKGRGDAVVVWGPGLGEVFRADESGYKLSGEHYSYIVRGKEGINRISTRVSESAEGKDSFSELEDSQYVSWLGLEDTYFMVLADGGASTRFVPNYRLERTAEVQVSGGGKKNFIMPFVGFRPRTGEAHFDLYVGPKDFELLEKIEGGKYRSVVQFGMFAFVSRPALWLLNMIYSVVHNYGFAIITLTVFINILLLPLMIKQRTSMAAMQKLQPLIKQLQAKHKVERSDDIQTRQKKKEKLNQELMALYKTEGVNPMGGCLPLLIQLPILFALFDMFRVAIELRKAPFILWLDNLALPDPYFVTPILMGVVMFLSQQISPAAAAQSNATMKMLPFIFVFFFMNVASGLVLYWLTSSLFNFGMQAAMNTLKPVTDGGGPKKGEKKVGAAKAAGKKGKKHD